MPAARSRRRAAALAVATLVSLWALVACGDDDASSAPTTAAPTTTSAEEAMCADRDAVVESIRALADVDIVASGTDGIREALGAVEDDLDDLRASASENFAPEIDALTDALRELRDALGDLDSAGVDGVVSAAGDVISTGRDLVDELQSVDCP